MADRHSALSLVIAILLSSCSSSSSAEPRGDDPPAIATRADGAVVLAERARAFVSVEPATTGHGVVVLNAPARVAYRDGSIAQVGSPVSGRVAELHVRLGDVVDEGSPLVTLRSPDAAAARAELSATRAALEHALAEARRTAGMLESGVASDRERREADLRASELEIQLARVRTQVAILGRGSGGTVVLRAPIAGTVLSRRASAGMAVEPDMSEPLVEIGDPRAIGIVAEVFDRDAAMVEVGAGATVTLPSLDAPLRGHVTYVAPVVSAGLRTVQARIELDESSDRLRHGLFGRAAITLVDAGIVVPSTAVLVRDGARTVVYVERDPGTYLRRDVEIGPSIEGRVHVVSGLAEGERVVVEGALLLDGASDQLL